MKTLGRIGAAVLVASLGVQVAAAHAERMPTKAEAAALRSAFTHGHRGAKIVVMKVSTVDRRWAQIDAALHPRRALSAKPKIITLAPFDYELSNGKAAPAQQQPPKAVKRDLAKDEIADLVFQGSGRETGSDHGLESDGCTQADTSLTSLLSWTVSYRIDLNKPVMGLGTGDTLDFYAVAVEPTLGEMTDTYSWAETDAGRGCGGGETFTCTAAFKVFKAHAFFFSFRQDGVALSVPFSQTSGSCSNGGAPSAGLYTARWFKSLMQVFAPIRILPENFGGPGVVPVKFPTNALPAGQPVTATDPTNCSLGPTLSGCSDTLNWSGTVAFSLLGGG